jgi:glucosyl-dolichyl phosphate glucuronosyltransferase
MSNFVSVILPTRDRAGELAQTLQALERSCCRDRDTYTAELIVVDNASADETAKVVRGFRSARLNVRYVCESRKGRARCVNRALLEAKGDIILLLDDDVRPQPGWIPTMCTPIWEGRADAVAGGVTMAPHLRRNWMEDFHRGFLTTTDGWDPGGMKIMLGANCAFSRNVLDKVPAFDPELGAGALGFCEDILFSAQMVNAGYRLTAVLDHPVTHHFDPSRLSRDSFMRRAEAEGRSRAYIAHHWEQREIRFPFLRVCDAFVRLQMKRRLPGARWPHKEGIAEWEFWSICRLAFRQQFMRERRRARNYGEARALKPLKQAFGIDRDVSDPL